MTDWQPIETAPKDGTPVMLFFPQKFGMGAYSVRYWSLGEWGGKLQSCWADEWRQITSDIPSHWMPVPNPPSPA